MTVDDPRFASAGMTVQVVGSTAIIKCGESTARVLIKGGGELQFAPASSAAQRLVLATITATAV